MGGCSGRRDTDPSGARWRGKPDPSRGQTVKPVEEATLARKPIERPRREVGGQARPQNLIVGEEPAASALCEGQAASKGRAGGGDGAARSTRNNK